MRTLIILAVLFLGSQSQDVDFDNEGETFEHEIYNMTLISIGTGDNGTLDDNENFTDTTRSMSPTVDGNFIVGGRTARRREQPWMVSVQIYYYGYWYHICGGALIQSHKVAVAAHCMWRWRLYYYYYYYGYYRRFRFRVGLGWYDLRLGRANPYSQTIFVKKVDFHPEYRRGRVGKIYYPNDIAI
ncbi:chymotrypsin-like elastase family member 2A, partial [Aplysia californica]|uniref:Chymotrypsin-like elastase family member 2A n=1 Tax=Aplysia californica TaxID=6500 RepID=A0ABM0JTQ2_APLCA